MAEASETLFRRAEQSLERIGLVGVRVFDQIRGKILQTVALGAPVVFQRFQLAMRDLSGIIGQVLAPVLTRATALVRQLADAIANLSPETVAAIQATVAFVGALSLAVSIIPRVTAALRAIQVAGAALGLGLGPLVAVLAVVAAVIAAMTEGSGGLSDTMESLAAAFRPLGEALVGLFEALMPLVVHLGEVLGAVLLPVIELVVKAITALVEWFVQLINWVRRLLGMEEIRTPARERERRTAVGAGGRQVSFLSGEDIQRRAVEAALGARKDPAAAVDELSRQQAAEAQRAERQRDELTAAVRGKAWDRDSKNRG